jgi:pentatricopeptide repeat protein
MGIASEIFSVFTGNLVEQVFGSGVARKVRKVLPELPPEPQIKDHMNDKRDGRVLFRDLRFFGGITRYVAPETLWQDFEAFYRAPLPMSWWLITGSAGSGKSRNAFEFCKALETGRARFFDAGKFRSLHLEPVPGENHSFWRAGFADLDNTPFKTWETWQPRQHTLLVFDGIARHYNARLHVQEDGEDARRNRHNIVEIIRLLTVRAAQGDFDNFRVRLLLLERDGWEDRHLDWHRALPKRSVMCFRTEPTPLPPLTPEGLHLSIAGDVHESIRLRHEGAPLHDIPADFLDRLKAIDSERRPLYAMLLAAWLAGNEGQARTITRNDILDCAFLEEYERQLKPVGEEKAARILRAVAMSTLTGGRAGACGMGDVYDLWYSGFGYEADDGAFRPYPVEPDILGEYLVLRGLERELDRRQKLEREQKREQEQEQEQQQQQQQQQKPVREEKPALEQEAELDLDLSLDLDRLEQEEALAQKLGQALELEQLGQALEEGRALAREQDQVLELEQLLDHPGDDVQALIHKAWEAFPAVVSGFFGRCAQNFASDPQWVETRFLSDQLINSNVTTRLWYMQTAASLIPRLGKDQIGMARKVFDEMASHGGKSLFRQEQARAASSLIRAYGDAGMIDEAFSVFIGMNALVGNSESARVSYAEASASLIENLCKAGEFVRARLLFESMRLFGDLEKVRSARADALISLINGYGRTGEFAAAHALLNGMAKFCGDSWSQRAKASVNLVVLYAKAGRMDDACAVFESMSALDNTPTVQEERTKAFRFLEFFTARKIRAARADTLISLINSHGRTGALAEARALLNGMPRLCGGTTGLWVQRAKASVNLVILYARAGHAEEANRVYEAMSALGNGAAVRAERDRALKFLRFFAARARGTQEPGLAAEAA